MFVQTLHRNDFYWERKTAVTSRRGVCSRGILLSHQKAVFFLFPSCQWKDKEILQMSRLKGWSRMCRRAMTCERSASKNRKAFGSVTGCFNDNPVGGTAVECFSGKTNVSCEWDTENTDVNKVTFPSSRVRVQRFKYLQDEAVKDCTSKISSFILFCFDKSSLNFKSQTETMRLHIRCVNADRSWSWNQSCGFIGDPVEVSSQTRLY